MSISHRRTYFLLFCIGSHSVSAGWIPAWLEEKGQEVLSRLLPSRNAAQTLPAVVPPTKSEIALYLFFSQLLHSLPAFLYEGFFFCYGNSACPGWVLCATGLSGPLVLPLLALLPQCPRWLTSKWLFTLQATLPWLLCFYTIFYYAAHPLLRSLFVVVCIFSSLKCRAVISRGLTPFHPARSWWKKGLYGMLLGLAHPQLFCSILAIGSPQAEERRLGWKMIVAACCGMGFLSLLVALLQLTRLGGWIAEAPRAQEGVVALFYCMITGVHYRSLTQEASPPLPAAALESRRWALYMVGLSSLCHLASYLSLVPDSRLRRAYGIVQVAEGQ